MGYRMHRHRHSGLLDRKKQKNELFYKSTPGTPLCVRGQETAESLAEKRIKLRLLRVGGLGPHDLKRIQSKETMLKKCFLREKKV